MKSSLSFLVLTLCAGVALAEPPAAGSRETQTAASRLVKKQLVTPMKRAESKRSRFSRAAPVPLERRVRVLDADMQTDVRGKKFVRFAIDVRRALGKQGAWQKDRVVGCAYLDEREVYVQSGEAYLPAASLLGKDASERTDVCRAAPVG